MPSSYTELNGADEATVGPIRESLKASEKARSLRFPAAAAPPTSAEMPSLVGAAGKSLVVNATESGIDFANSVGATVFTGLGDVPSSYVGQAGKKVIVKATEDGLDFVPDSGGGGGSGDVVGPASATDNAIARFDGGTGKGIQNSPVTISDNGTIAMVAAATGYPSANIPHGAAPASPVNGDMWTTTSGLYVRVNGATVGPLAAAAGISNFTEALTTAAPNATVTVASFTATGAATNIDFAVRAKGTGALLAHIPDNTATGGNKRGSNAVDWQTVRSAATRVASGNSAMIGGGENNTSAGLAATVSGGSANSSGGDYAAVAGGNGNSASGNRTAIGGGSSNTASATNAAVSGGSGNTASGLQSAVAGGSSNIANALNSAVGGGTTNTASGQSSWAQGDNCTASGICSIATGSRSITRGILGAQARASARFTVDGDAQEEGFVLSRATTNATPAVLTTDAAAPAATNIPVLPNSHAYKFRGMVIARAAGGDVKTWDISGTIKRGANAAATALVGTPAVVSTDADTGAASWTVAVTADTTLGGIAVTATGAVATNIKWVVRLETVEVG